VIAQAFEALGLQVLERGWLSSNSVVFRRTAHAPATVVDTGYVAHAAQTAALVEQALAGDRLERIVNTHLHSDHCGGNARLQAGGSDVSIWVPEASWQAVQRWDEDALSFRYTGQRCDRFTAARTISRGETLALGHSDEWQVHAAPGHDPDAVLLFEPHQRVLVSGDALWQDRLAIVFPALLGPGAYGAVHSTLDLIERLSPKVVIPGHGAAFSDVAQALERSRDLALRYEAEPDRHALHAARALTMFRMLEMRVDRLESTLRWMRATPVFEDIRRSLRAPPAALEFARDSVLGLVRSGHLWQRNGDISCAE
jgi:glyoxylase-like metal-dependent hydrolase (beta-lactamase superfamily II)